MKIGVMGAGAVGSFVGGKLLGCGLDVTFVGRPSGKEDAEAHGMKLESIGGTTAIIPPSQVRYALGASALSTSDVVLFAVKSAQTGECGADLAKVLRPGTLVVSLQNGIHNADKLREQLPNQEVLGGIVGFNVVASKGSSFRQATSGPLVIEWLADPRLSSLAQHLEAAGFQVERPKNIRAKQWSKLVMNLGNALSALSGATTRDLLFEPGYRAIVRAVMKEAIGILRKANIELSRLGPLPATVFPFVLGLPNRIFELAVRAQLRIDPEARSSMWQDLSRRRTTEVDELNGEIVRVAQSIGARAPLNERLVELVHAAEREGNGSPNWSPATLSNKLRPN